MLFLTTKFPRGILSEIISSGRVLQKIGMMREGVLEDDVMKDGKFLAVELYGIVSPV